MRRQRQRDGGVVEAGISFTEKQANNDDIAAGQMVLVNAPAIMGVEVDTQVCLHR